VRHDDAAERERHDACAVLALGAGVVRSERSGSAGQ